MSHRVQHRLTSVLAGGIVLALVASFAPSGDAIAAAAKHHHKSPAPKTVYAISDDPNSTLYRLNTHAKSKKVLGSTGTQMTDIAFVGKALYAMSFTALYRLNVKTGAAQEIGSFVTQTANAMVADPKNNTLYGADQQGDFFTIDRGTGQIDILGDFGNGVGSAGDLAFYKGKLYATVFTPPSTKSSLARIAVHTGLATTIGDIGSHNVYGLISGSNGLYGATKNGRLIAISPKTGKGKLLWKDGLDIAGLA
jgi:hypothetical protein